MKLHTTIEAINKSIESIARRGKQLDRDIHVSGVSILAHIDQHSDATVLDRLVQAMPQGARKGALCEWACAFGKVRMLDRSNDRDKAAIEQGRLFKFDKTKVTNIEQAIAQDWTTFKPEPDLLTTFDAAKAVNQIMQRLNKSIKGGADVVGTEAALKTLKAIEQTLGTLTVSLTND